MKKGLFLIFVLIALGSCKNESKTEKKQVSSEGSQNIEKQDNGLTILKGEFVYIGDAAVIQTRNDIYGVIIDDKMHELNEQVQKYKSEITDMVPVEVKGKLIPKPENEEGWDYRVEIIEIVNVSKPNPEGNEIITLGKE